MTGSATGFLKGAVVEKFVRRLPLFIEVVLLGKIFVDISAMTQQLVISKFDTLLTRIDFKELLHRNTYLKTLIA